MREPNDVTSDQGISDVSLHVDRFLAGANGLRDHGLRRVVAIALTAGIAAGLGAWTVGEREHHAFRPRLYPQPRWEATWMEPTAESKYAAESKNAALANAIMGCAAAFAIGLGGGLAASTPSRGLFVGLCAQAAGLVAGGVAALVVIRLFDPVYAPPVRTVTHDVWWPLLIHAGSWCPIGVIGGAAFALGSGSRSRFKNIVASATAGALLAAVVFQLIAICLPLEAGATRPLARAPFVRLVAMIVPTFLIAAGAALGAVNEASRPSSPIH